MNTLEEMEKRLEEKERQAEEKKRQAEENERQAKEIEAESAINQIIADVERISYLSKEKESLDEADFDFNRSIRKKYFLAGLIASNDIETLIRTYDVGEVHKKKMAEDESYAESVRTMNEAGKLIGRSFNPSGLDEIKSEPTGDERVDSFELQHILSLSEPDFTHCVNNLYQAKENYEGAGRQRIVLKPETIKRLKVLRENKELANRLIEALKDKALGLKLRKYLDKRQRKIDYNSDFKIGLITIGVAIAIIVAIIVKCVA
ncbi:MAG: hypothetical protein LBQ82_07090 [Treponema sp.]|jgi:hypothetical protein|nr:hypothetical protein [Treponema sp.]